MHQPLILCPRDGRLVSRRLPIKQSNRVKPRCSYNMSTTFNFSIVDSLTPSISQEWAQRDRRGQTLQQSLMLLQTEAQLLQLATRLLSIREGSSSEPLLADLISSEQPQQRREVVALCTIMGAKWTSLQTVSNTISYLERCHRLNDTRDLDTAWTLYDKAVALVGQSGEARGNLRRRPAGTAVGGIGDADRDARLMAQWTIFMVYALIMPGIRSNGSGPGSESGQQRATLLQITMHMRCVRPNVTLMDACRALQERRPAPSLSARASRFSPWRTLRMAGFHRLAAASEQAKQTRESPDDSDSIQRRQSASSASNNHTLSRKSFIHFNRKQTGAAPATPIR